jgi:CRISPR-associated endonuclease/helicase Cas3
LSSVSPSAGERQKSVAMTLVPTIAHEETARRAIPATPAGARVLVIRNTVSAAIATWEAVIAAGQVHLLLRMGGPFCHHSRFAGEDRCLPDVAVEIALSPVSHRDRGVIVIGS